MKRIVVLTGSELRHSFFRMALANERGIEVLRSYCEGMENSLDVLVAHEPEDSMRKRHIQLRTESETDFFGAYVKAQNDNSQPVFIPRGKINGADTYTEILSLTPGIVVAYGCSLIKTPLLAAFLGRFLNVHLGLSPYYRGAGTNYWPLVNGEPEYVGATFMHIDTGIDTGAIIHQLRARIQENDTPSVIGNRLIADMVPVCADIIRKLDELPFMFQPEPLNRRAYRQADYDEDSVRQLYANFQDGLVDRYLSEIDERAARAPIVENPALVSCSA